MTKKKIIRSTVLSIVEDHSIDQDRLISYTANWSGASKGEVLSEIRNLMEEDKISYDLSWDITKDERSEENV